MLPPILKQMKDKLEAKGYSSRSSYEDELFEELKVTDQALDSKNTTDLFAANAGIQKLSSNRTGPILGTCPTCGR